MNYDNAIYQTITIFQKGSGFLEWERIHQKMKPIFIL